MVIGQCWRGLEMTTTQKTPNNSMIDSNHTLYRTHPYFNLTPNPPPSYSLPSHTIQVFPF